MNEALAEAVEAVRALLGDAVPDEVTCEVTRHGTVKIVVKRGEKPIAQHQWKAR